MTLAAALIGRDRERESIVTRLSERRLVTLVGPGGIGKTTLAQACAAMAADSFADGVRTVDLTLVDTPDEVSESIASQLGYASFRALIDSPSDLPVLLVVDNCEHVIEQVAEALEQLLAACDAPTILATSRIPLGLHGEAVMPIGPLRLPDGDHVDGPAVALLVERANDAGAAIEPSPVVVELCRRLDGIPLALELAAARMRSMSPEDVLTRLGESLDVLHRPRSRAAPRHRSLRTAIDWSYTLLDEDARRLVADLSVFSGPFDTLAAHDVGGLPSHTPSDTQDRLHDLVDASMLVADVAAGTTKYRLLDTVRQYGRERLDAEGRRLAVEGRFVDHTVATAARIIEQGASTWSAAALTELRQSYPSISAAIRWCLKNDDEPDRALLLTAVLWGLVHQAHTEQVGELAEQVLQRWSETSQPMVSDVAATAATCRYMLGDNDGAIALALSHLERAERSPFAPATLRRAIAQASRATGDTDGAMRWFGEAADAARRLGLASMAAESMSAQAQILADLGDIDGALERVELARAEAAAAESEVGVAWARVITGSILLRRDADEAVGALTDSLELTRSLGYDAGTSVCQRSLAMAALLRGDAIHAAAHTAQLLDDLLARGSTYELRMVLDLAAAIARAVGHGQLASDLAATAVSLPVVSITASVGHELFPLDPSDGNTLPVRDAITSTRAMLLDVAATPVAADSPGERSGEASGAERESTGEICRRGDSWEVTFAGERVVLRHSKGLGDLARLLAAPGREVHCLELSGAGVEQPSTGPAFDGAARQRYEEEIRTLHDEIVDADAANDSERSARARAELDQIVDHLAVGLGLSGATRSAGSTSERARSAVTQRIRSTIRRIEAVHPALGRHLDTSIRTGTWCCYRPEHDVIWVHD